MALTTMVMVKLMKVPATSQKMACASTAVNAPDRSAFRASALQPVLPMKTVKTLVPQSFKQYGEPDEVSVCDPGGNFDFTCLEPALLYQQARSS